MILLVIFLILKNKIYEFFYQLKYHIIYVHKPWKLTLFFLSSAMFLLILLCCFGIFPLSVSSNIESLLQTMAQSASTFFIFLISLIVLIIQVSTQRYTWDFHRRILLNSYFLLYTFSLLLPIFTPLYALSNISRFQSKELMILVNFSFTLLLYLGTLEDKNFNFIWKAWIEIEDEDNPLIFSVWERIKIFWKKLLEIEEEFPQKFINIGEEKLRDAIIKDELKAKEKIDIFREFKNIGEKKGKNEIAKECNEIYNELKNLQKK